jgi:cytochrome P450
MEEAADRSIDRWPMSARFSLHREMQEVTLDVILRAVFGIAEGADKQDVRRALVRMLAFGEHPVLLLLIGPDGELRWKDLEKRLGRFREGSDEYLDAVVKEGLRLHPIVPVVARRLQAPATVGGREYPAGAVLAPNIYLTHRNPKVWANPDRFDPSRFLGWKTNPYEFLPFGGGVRRCIGLAFALFEMKHVLRRIVQRTRLRLAQGYRPRLVRRGVTFAVSEGLPLILESRMVAPPRSTLARGS